MSAENQSVSLYDALAQHVTEGRAPDIDPEKFRDWLSLLDGGDDATWEKVDDALDEFVERFRAAPDEGESDPSLFRPRP